MTAMPYLRLYLELKLGWVWDIRQRGMDMQKAVEWGEMNRALVFLGWRLV
jgi:hypothetical protein